MGNQLLDQPKTTNKNNDKTVEGGFGSMQGNSIKTDNLQLLSGKTNENTLFKPFPEVPIVPTDGEMTEVRKVMDEKRIIESIVENSKPSNADLTDFNDDRDKVLEQWKANIVKNYNDLVETANDEVFDLETQKGDVDRSNTYNKQLLKADRKLAKLSYREQMIDSRKDKSLTKDKRKTLKNAKKEKLSALDELYADKQISQDDALTDNMIGRQDEEMYKDNVATNIDEVKQDKEKQIDAAYKRIQDKRSPIGKIMAKIFGYARKNVTISLGGKKEYGKIIDPDKMFKFNTSDASYRFELRKITENDVTALVIPRAKDSIVDATSSGESVYANIKKIDDSEGDKDKKQEEFQEVIGDYKPEYTASNKEAYTEWETNQATLEKEELTGHYIGLYGLKTDFDEWKEANQKRIDKGEFDSEGNASAATRTSLYEWLSTHTPNSVDGVAVQWDNTEMRFAPMDINEAAQGAKAEELNGMIGGGGPNAQIKGNEIDAIKLKFLVGLSQQYIEPQKWSQTYDAPTTEAGEKYKSAGGIKKGSETNKLDDHTSARKFVQNQGLYNTSDAKRYSDYGTQSPNYVPPKEGDEPKVEDRLTWMVDYKVQVYKKPN